MGNMLFSKVYGSGSSAHMRSGITPIKHTGFLRWPWTKMAWHGLAAPSRNLREDELLPVRLGWPYQCRRGLRAAGTAGIAGTNPADAAERGHAHDRTDPGYAADSARRPDPQLTRPVAQRPAARRWLRLQKLEQREKLLERHIRYDQLA